MGVVAGVVFALVPAAVVGFQLALALKPPGGACAMGGAYPGSHGERRLWLPVTLLLLATSLIVTLS